MKRVILVAATLVALAGIAVAAVATAGATTEQYRPTLEIQYAEAGCHTWALNGGAAGVEHYLQLRVGQSLTVVNHDICAHTLVQTNSGTLAVSSLPSASPTRHVRVPSFTEDELVTSTRSTAATVDSMSFGEGALVTFNEPGNYELTTREGDVLFGGWPTVGPDNQLVVHVQVANHNAPIE